jgi:hypothetical protein
VRRSRARRLAVARVGEEDPANQVGRWTDPPFAMPNYAMNAALLPTGKVMFWSWPPVDSPGHRPNYGAAALWDPSQGTGAGAFESIPPPLVDPDGPSGPQGLVPAPIACSGQSFQADGSLLLAGGNLIYPGDPGDAYTNWAGLGTVFTFNPWTETWKRQPDMEEGRWYPGQVELADGRTVILSGYTDAAPGGVFSSLMEIFDPTAPLAERVSPVPSGARTTSLYPRMFTLPDRNVLLAGPDRPESAILDTETFTWRGLPMPARNHGGGNSVLLRGGWTVQQIGGYDWREDPGTGSIPASASTETIDAHATNPQWTPGPPLNVPRSYANTVLLPDGSMVAIGGGAGRTAELGAYEVEPDHLRVELYDPQTKSWRLGPAQQEFRAYHSTAVLLPDGRVWSAGDDFHPTDSQGNASQTDSAEVYSPPYLYKPGRPAVTGAPAEIRYGERFDIAATGGPRSAVLMAPSATTHADDMSQRRVPLRGIKTASGLRLFAPPGPGVAPPGYYMLFALDWRGVPSVARWVKLGPS